MNHLATLAAGKLPLANLKVMPDYNCWPIWYNEAEAVGPIEPSSLDISERLASVFDRWKNEFDESLNPSDPAGSRLEDEDRFVREGRRLAQRLQEELGSEHTVRYWTDQSGTVA